jgi:hypothetical protein
VNLSEVSLSTVLRLTVISVLLVGANRQYPHAGNVDENEGQCVDLGA